MCSFKLCLAEGHVQHTHLETEVRVASVDHPPKPASPFPSTEHRRCMRLPHRSQRTCFRGSVPRQTSPFQLNSFDRAVDLPHPCAATTNHPPTKTNNPTRRAYLSAHPANCNNHPLPTSNTGIHLHPRSKCAPHTTTTTTPPPTSHQEWPSPTSKPDASSACCCPLKA